MAFVRVHATLIAMQTKKRFPWSKPEVTEMKREGFLTLNLSLCVEIFALPPNQYGVPLEIVRLKTDSEGSTKWIPHITPYDYVEVVRAMALFGLADIVSHEQTIVYN